jgi:hypothetical protein
MKIHPPLAFLSAARALFKLSSMFFYHYHPCLSSAHNRQRSQKSERESVGVALCVCVCVWEREREREEEGTQETKKDHETRLYSDLHFVCNWIDLPRGKKSVLLESRRQTERNEVMRLFDSLSWNICIIRGALSLSLGWFIPSPCHGKTCLSLYSSKNSLKNFASK